MRGPRSHGIIIRIFSMKELFFIYTQYPSLSIQMISNSNPFSVKRRVNYHERIHNKIIISASENQLKTKFSLLISLNKNLGLLFRRRKGKKMRSVVLLQAQNGVAGESWCSSMYNYLPVDFKEGLLFNID